MEVARCDAPFTHALFNLASDTDDFMKFTLKPCTLFEVDPAKEIKLRKSDRMIHGHDLTTAASNGKKRFDNWFRLDASKAFISALERSTTVDLAGDRIGGPTPSKVVDVVKGGQNDDRGVWIHAKLIDKVIEWAQLPATKQKELPVQERVAMAMRGSECEVRCPAGMIDIVTHDPPVIVEVKEVTHWIKGVGQLMAYGHYFPDYEKRLFIFRTGKVNTGQIRVIEDVCEGCGIELALDEDFYDDVDQ
eukprot:jgi/Mesvir1/25805/Mv26126-RA.1